MPTYLRILVFIWAFVAMSTNVKVALLPYIDWMLTALLLPCLLRYCRPKITIPQVVFLATIIIVGATSDLTALGAVWAGKFAAIFVVISCLASAPWPVREAFMSFVAALYANALLVVLSMFGFDQLCQVVSASGRSATILNYPGALWRAGLGCLFYYGYLACVRPKGRFFSVIAAAASAALIYVDGSRTGMIMLLCLPIALLLASLKDRIYWVACTVMATVLVLVIIIVELDFTYVLDENNPLARWAFMFEGRGSLVDRLQDCAPDRYQMIQRTVGLIQEHPLTGNGLQAATIEIDVKSKEMIDVVAHNGYLQVWANLGLAGFISFIFIVLSWLGPFRIFVTSPPPADISERALLYNAIFLLFVFTSSLLFHPMSTEWSEWIIFAVPYAILVHAVPRRVFLTEEKIAYDCRFAVVHN